MARPLRRVCIGLSIRLGFPVEQVERWPISQLREYMAMLLESSGSKSEKSPDQPSQQTESDMVATFAAVAASFKGE